MKSHLLDLLRYLECHGEQMIEVLAASREVVEEGIYVCAACRRTDPMVGGIRRLPSDKFVQLMPRFHADFFRR